MASYDEYKKMLAQQNQQQNQSLNYGLANSGPAAGMNGLSGANATGHIDAPGNAVNLPNNGNATGHVNMPWKGIDLPYGGNTGNTGGNATGHLDTPGTAINFPRGGDTGGNATGHIPGNGQPYSPQSWSDRVAALYDQITNRPKFSYDPNSDGLYQSYKDLYTQAGRRAMEDTMGQAAGLTGGYGSTYSQAVGQQQYGDYMTRLNAELPNLYAQARSAYDKEGDDLWNRYNMAMQMENQEYNRGRDAMADERYENEWNYQKEQDAYNRERQERLDAADRAYQEWQMGRADRSDARDLVLTMIQAGKTPPADMLEAAGISLSYAQTMASYYANQMKGYGGSDRGSQTDRGVKKKKRDEDEEEDPEGVDKTHTPTRQITSSQARDLLKMAQQMFPAGALQNGDMDEVLRMMEDLYPSDLYGNFLNVANDIWSQLLKDANN